MFTFEIEWPEPFEQGLKRSGKRFETSTEAGKALGEWLAISFDNDVQMTGRIVKVDEE